MNIEQLPVEMLIKIFGYLPTYGEVSLVNKLFYGIACTVHDPNICLRIHNQMDSECLHSIRTSNRQITNIEIGIRCSQKARSLYMSLIGNFSSTIKRLTCKFTYMDESMFLELLSLTPNVERLDLLDLLDYNECRPPHKRRCNDTFNLMKLKSLSIIGCDPKFVRFMNFLPVGVLTELQIIDFNWCTFTDVLNRQLNIRKLNFGSVQNYQPYDLKDKFSTEVFDKLKLEYLKFNGSNMSSDAVLSILSKQRGLKSVIFSDTKFKSGICANNRLTNAVADLLDLETLEIDVTDTTDESFAKVLALKKLKNLTFTCGFYERGYKSTTLAESDNTSITRLTIRGSFRMSVDQIRSLARSAPNLKFLSVTPDNDIKRDELNEILTRFNFIEGLEIEMFTAPSVDHGDYFNSTLREGTFDLNGHFYEDWLTKLIAAYPNLKKLKLKLYSSEIRPLSIQTLLDGFPKLESLALYADQLIVEDLDTLQCRKNKLIFLKLGRLKKTELTDKLLKTLFTKFGLKGVCEYGKHPFYLPWT